MNYKDINGFEEWLKDVKGFSMKAVDVKSSHAVIFYIFDSEKWQSLDETCKLALLAEYLRCDKIQLDVYVSLSGAFTENGASTWFWSINDEKYQKGSKHSYNEALIEGLEQAIKLIEI